MKLLQCIQKCIYTSSTERWQMVILHSLAYCFIPMLHYWVIYGPSSQSCIQVNFCLKHQETLGQVRHCPLFISSGSLQVTLLEGSVLTLPKFWGSDTSSKFF